MNYFVYVLYNSEIDRFYVGSTQNIEKRIIYHNKTHRKKYTSKQKGIWQLLYQELFSSRSQAMLREKFIKSRKSRVYIKKLIESID